MITLTLQLGQLGGIDDVYAHITSQCVDGVAHIRLSRPDRLNTLGMGPGSSRAEIVDAMRVADADERVGCILLTAQGRAFSAGGDLTGGSEPSTTFDEFQFVRELEEFYTALRQIRKPIVAGVNGLCLGAGMGLLAQCDLVVAAHDARFGLVEGRIGHPGATEVVPIIGGAWAKFLMLTGELIDAETAERIGLVIAVTHAENLAIAAMELARRIAAVPRESAILNKAAIDAMTDAIGHRAGRITGHAYDAITKAVAQSATAPDGRRFSDIVRTEGASGLKKARDQQFTGRWFDVVRRPTASTGPHESGGTRRRPQQPIGGVSVTESFNAVVIDDVDGKPKAAIRELTTADLPDHDTLVKVDYSSLNYKDGLAVSGKGRIARKLPLIAGADLAGTVVESRNSQWPPGTKVVVNGWGMSETTSGGYTRYQRVKSEWLVRIPAAFTPEQAMAIGTAGYTSALCVSRLENYGLTSDMPILVTGAAGGVGSIAVALLAALGRPVAGSTGRPAAHGYLSNLGASEIVDRAELLAPGKPLQKERWAGGIDTVGGATLVNVLSQTAYGGAVAACGLAGGNDLPNATVLPHILRGVALLGIDSVMAPQATRQSAWDLLARTITPDMLSTISTVAPMSDVFDLADAILAGEVRGRVVIDVTR